MAKITDLFVSMARDTSATELLQDEGRGYRNLVSRGKYSLNWVLPNLKEAFSLGHTLQDTLKVARTGRTIRGGSGAMTFSGYDNLQGGVKISAPISYAATPLVWNESEIAANLEPSMGPKYVRSQFQKTLDAKHQDLYDDMVEDLEQGLWNVADQTNMENGDKFLSIPYYITENATTASALVAGQAIQADGVTSITAVNGQTVAATNGTYDNIRMTYATTGGDAGDASDLIGALVGAMRRANFQGMPVGAEYASPESIPEVILTSDWGCDLVQAAHRNSAGNSWGAMTMTPYGLQIGSMNFVNLSILNDAALYINEGGDGLVAETTANNKGPRYYGITRKYMRLMFQMGNFMQPDDPTNLTADGKPYDLVQIFKSANQLWCPDRRRHFIVSPSADVAA
jgi:hypothetical protein